jgi:hypothetical protein
MRYYTKRNTSTEAIAVAKIELGIQSIKKGTRTCDEVGSNLEFFFDRLKDINSRMYEDLFMKYCIVRLEAEKKEIKEIHS